MPGTAYDPPLDESPADFEALRFHVGARQERHLSGKVETVVRVTVEGLLDGTWEDCEGEEFSDLPDFLYCDGSRLYASCLSVQETTERLLALGWTHEKRMFLWYRLDQLAFGFLQDQGDISIFLFPMEERCDFACDLLPCEDNLRGDNLECVPDFLAPVTMENTFPLTAPLGVSEIKARLTGLGLTYDPEMDETY